MKKFLSLCLTLMLVFSTLSIQCVFGATISNEEDIIPGELIVSFKMSDSMKNSIDKNSVDGQEEALESVGLNVLDSMVRTLEMNTNSISSNRNDFVDTLGSVYLVKYDTDKYSFVKTAIVELKRELEKLGYNIKYIEPNYKVKATDIDVTSNYYPSYTLNENQAWHYRMIKAPEAWETTIGSPNVVVAVVDTGIDYNHNCLENFVDVNLSKSFVDGNTDPLDDNNHGTHVAGTIASYGVVSGVMRNAKLIAVKVLDSQGSGSTYSVQEGITYAANSGADVINMSLGGGSYQQSMQDACTYAINQGTVVVAATGNSYSNTVSYPAKYEGVIGVGNVKSDRSRAPSSQYGEGLDISAPGTNIYSTVRNNQFATYSGTSMATPHVSGVVGLMRAANPDATVQEICNAIFNTAQYAGSMNEYGYGIIDAEACVLAMNGGPVDPPTPEDPTQMNVDLSVSSSFFGIYMDQQITVNDQENNPIADATVTLNITCPNGSVINKTLTTNSNGVATNSLSAWSYGYGDYTFNIVVEKTGYETATLNRTVNFN